MIAIVRATCLFTLALFLTGANAEEFDYTVKLQTGEFVPRKMQTVPASASSLTDKYVFIQFDKPVTDAQRDRLEGDGVVLLQYIPNLTYTARLDQPIDRAQMDRYGIRWFDRIAPEQKISPTIGTYGIFDWARRGDDLVQFVVVLHPDQDGVYWQQELERSFGAQIIGLEPSMNAIDLILPEPAFYRLSELEAIAWIEQAPPFPEVTNDDARANTGAATLQISPWNLDGTGVMVAEWDGGAVDQFHSDFGGRVQSMDLATISAHSTHVAGTVVGSGMLGGGVYRGMAPNANLSSWLWWGSGSEAQAEYTTAITNRNARIATNSWGYGVGDPATQSSCEANLGNYFTVCGTLDNIVRGSSGGPISITWSAGNQRGTASKYCGSIGWTFGTIGALACAKNVITVGAINSNNNTMTSFSSWGPTDDGRVKPDVVGPGCQSTGDGGLTSTLPGNSYGTMCGTSMSTPATAGVLALVFQHWDNTIGTTAPLPSTIKGILINSADNLGPDGPDFVYGHGVVNAVAAVKKIGSGSQSYVEGEIATGTNHVYDLTIGGNVDKLKVTLVWDDPGGTVSASQHLINDLDLVLIDPFASEAQPWILDPANPVNSATTGPDRLNNVETVEIDNPQAGLWKAKVTGFNIPNGPQSYSLIFTPDSIHTPGNLAALAVYDQGDVEEQPGQPATVDFWVSNIGANLDSVSVTISDNNGWLIQSVTDSVVMLDAFDSALFSLSAAVPPLALAGEADIVTCLAVSKTDSLVSASLASRIIAAAFYSVSAQTPPDDTAASPDTTLFSVTVSNLGNDTDMVTIQPTADSGWSMLPVSRLVKIDPGQDSTVSFSVIFPAAIPDLAENTITIDVTSSGGAFDQTSFAIVTTNPYFPPELLSPDPLAYMQGRLPDFSWTGNGDSFSLYVAEDSLITNVVRHYPGLAGTSYTLPPGDELADGGYYWAVRAFVGSDSSSLQRYSRGIVIDNIAPRDLTPVYPAPGAYLKTTNFTFSFTNAAKVVPEFAPVVNYVQVSNDSLFGAGTLQYGPIYLFNLPMPDMLADGRWYWRAFAVDSAGNQSDTLLKASFVIDTEIPEIPIPATPEDGATFKPDTVQFTWTTGLQPLWEVAPEYYYMHISTQPTFSEFSVFTGYIYDDTLAYPGSNLIEGTTYYWRLKAFDSAGNFTAYSPGVSFSYRDWVCGDVTGDGVNVNLTDLTYLVNHLFLGGPPPPAEAAADGNCDGQLSLTDLTLLVNFLFVNNQPLCCME